MLPILTFSTSPKPCIRCSVKVSGFVQEIWQVFKNMPWLPQFSCSWTQHYLIFLQTPTTFWRLWEDAVNILQTVWMCSKWTSLWGFSTPFVTLWHQSCWTQGEDIGIKYGKWGLEASERKWQSPRSVWLCNPMDCSLPVSSVHGILQARILEWVAVPLSRGSSQPWDGTQASCIIGEFFMILAPREAQKPESQAII